MMKQPKAFHPISDSLPRSVTVDGKKYPIRWDFLTALRFMEYVEESQAEDEVFLEEVLRIWYPQIPENTDQALTQAIRFYCGGTMPREGYYAPLFLPQNKNRFCNEFLNRYGIDLTREPVHWWAVRRWSEYGTERRTGG